jgi:hypothetical protein
MQYASRQCRARRNSCASSALQGAIEAIFNRARSTVQSDKSGPPLSAADGLSLSVVHALLRMRDIGRLVRSSCACGRYPAQKYNSHPAARPGSLPAMRNAVPCLEIFGRTSRPVTTWRTLSIDRNPQRRTSDGATLVLSRKKNPQAVVVRLRLTRRYCIASRWMMSTTGARSVLLARRMACLSR